MRRPRVWDGVEMTPYLHLDAALKHQSNYHLLTAKILFFLHDPKHGLEGYKFCVTLRTQMFLLHLHILAHNLFLVKELK